ncbi:MAG: DUF4105 domain-containing protein [Calditrichaceae bacterium]|nr:DUF4105 domain-containing protein [Calditrichia bacterium]NUQ42184.1 DUF4105 domain-containing protein [Calditrichaceae bacterium]
MKRFIRRCILFAFLFLLISPESILSQPQLPGRLSPQAQISLLTVTPGRELYSTFGHSAIRIVDPPYQLDRIYNYGTFDFEEPGFYLKFTRGLLDYVLSAYSYSFAEYQYTEERRGIIQQTLALTPEMKQALYRFLEWNYRPENRRYRYDFFFDNCATRIRDVFEKTLGENLQLYLNPERRRSFRRYIDPYLVGHPVTHFGMDLGLGARSDRVASAREAMFLPDYLYESFAGATIAIEGQTLPFVARTDTLLWFPGADKITPALPWSDIILWGLFLVSGVLTYRALRSRKRSSPPNPWFDAILFGLTGLAGAMILFLWFGTDHKVTPDNWNLLWAWPLHLVAAGLLISRRKRRWPGWYFALYALLMVLVLAGWSFWPQEFHPAALPLALALAVRSGWRGYFMILRPDVTRSGKI